jgi:sugar phosphate isomerase/epimerase
MLGSVEMCLDHCVSVHLSDNNRLLPGHGAIDFGAFLRGLNDRGFKGVVALEGNIAVSFENDIRLSADYLSSLS